MFYSLKNFYSMNFKKIKLGILFFLMSFVGIAQNTLSEATVVGVISVGEQSYCFLNENGTSDIYKSSLFKLGELNLGQPVEVSRTETENQIEVHATSLTKILFATKEHAEEGNSVYYPNMSQIPVMTNGVLYFQNEEHMQEVYDILDLYINDPVDNLGLDEKLDKFELSEYFGYTSFRTAFNTKFNWLDGEFTERELEDIYAKDYIFDEIIKTFVNENGLISIGGMMYCYLDEDIILSTPSSNNEDISAMKSFFIEKDFSTYNKSDLYHLLFTSPDIRLESDHISANNDSKAIVVESNGYTYNSGPTVRISECNTGEFKAYFNSVLTASYEIGGGATQPVNSFNMLSDGSVSNVMLKIDWDDGSPLEIIQDYNGNEVEHNYGTGGVWYPKVSLYFYHGGMSHVIHDGTGTVNGTASSLYPSTSGNDLEANFNNGCSNEDTHTQHWDVQGRWKLASKAWIKDNGVFGTKVGAYTHSWWQKNNGNWKRKKANLSVKVHGLWRWHTDCSSIGTEEKFEHQDNTKKRQTSRSKLFHDYKMSGNQENWGISNLHVTNGPNIWRTNYLDPCQ